MSGGSGRLGSASPSSFIPENLFARPWTMLEEIKVWRVMGSDGDIRAWARKDCRRDNGSGAKSLAVLPSQPSLLVPPQLAVKDGSRTN